MSCVYIIYIIYYIKYIPDIILYIYTYRSRMRARDVSLLCIFHTYFPILFYAHKRRTLLYNYILVSALYTIASNPDLRGGVTFRRTDKRTIDPFKIP